MLIISLCFNFLCYFRIDVDEIRTETVVTAGAPLIDVIAAALQNPIMKTGNTAVAVVEGTVTA